MFLMNKSPSIRKWLTRCAVAAALIFVVLLVVVSQSHPPGIWLGKPLPPGKVKPQLANDLDTAVLLAPDGSLWAWGGSDNSNMCVFSQPSLSQVPRRVGSESDWMQVAVGGGHTMALKNDGSLWSWGWNEHGEAGQASLTNHYDTPTRIGKETNWSQICAGGYYNVALKRDGSLWAWGRNSFVQLDDWTTNDRLVPTMVGKDRDWRTIATEGREGYAIKANGTIWAWGQGSDDLALDQIGSGTNWLAISASDVGLLALTTDGTLWVRGPGAHFLASAFVSRPTTNLTQIGSETDWAEVYAKAYSFFACKKDGSWWVSGMNFTGELGLGAGPVLVRSPQRLRFGFEPWAFSLGIQTTFLLGKDGRLWTWGSRLGTRRPSAPRLKMHNLLAPLMDEFPSIRSIIESDTDWTPHLLWELPPEVRRSLGAGPNSATNDLTAGHSANTLRP
jgi:hypothetical protein